MTTYADLPGFESLYLEDSWVLDMRESEKTFHIDLEAVLTHEHPDWHAPKPGEQYCYRGTRIQFDKVQSVEWIELRMRPNKDPDGSIDFGNIDSFVYENNRYELEGEWGHLVVVSPSVPQVHYL